LDPNSLHCFGFVHHKIVVMPMPIVHPQIFDSIIFFKKKNNNNNNNNINKNQYFISLYNIIGFLSNELE